MSYPPEAQEKACVWAPQAQQAASPSLQNGPPRLFQREPRVIRVLHQQSHRAESLRAPRGRLIMTERKAAPEGTALHSLVSKREPLSFWQAVTEYCIPETQNWVQEGEGLRRGRSTRARPGRVAKLSGKLGSTLRTGLSAKWADASKAPEGSACGDKGNSHGDRQAGNPHSPNVGVFLATHYTQVLFNHQVVVSWGFRSSRRFKL